MQMGDMDDRIRVSLDHRPVGLEPISYDNARKRVPLEGGQEDLIQVSCHPGAGKGPAKQLAVLRDCYQQVVPPPPNSQEGLVHDQHLGIIDFPGRGLTQ